MKKSKKNNKGFSLVELIAAVAILATVTYPLLNSFVTANKLTNRSSEISEATLAAKNILETIDARPISEFQEVSSNNEAAKMLDSSIKGPYKQYLLEKDGTLSGYMLNSSSQKDNNYYESNVAARKRIDDIYGNFYTFISGVKAGSNRFDAVVKFFRGDFAEPDKGIFSINSNEIVKYSNSDAVFTQPYIKSQNPDFVAEQRFKELALTDHTINKKNYIKNREIGIFVYQTQTTVNGEVMDLVTARVKYYYNFDYYILDDDGYPTSSLKSETDSEKTKANGYFDPRFSIELPTTLYNSKPKNSDGSVSLFLAYYPNYDSNGSAKDVINVFSVARDAGTVPGTGNNEIVTIPKLTEADFDIYLYMQRPLTYMESPEDNDFYRPWNFIDASLYNRYKPEINLNFAESRSIENKKTLVYTNMYEALKTALTDGEDARAREAAVDYFKKRAVDYKLGNFNPNYIEGFIRGSSWQIGAGVSDTDKDILKQNISRGYLKKDADNRIYIVEIHVFSRYRRPESINEMINDLFSDEENIDGALQDIYDEMKNNDYDSYRKRCYKLEGTKTP